MTKTSQPCRGNHEDYLDMETRLEIHVEQAQAIVQNLATRDSCIAIAAIFITPDGYMLGKFPLHTTEDQFCQTVWEYAIEHDIDELFVTYPSEVFMIDAQELGPADYLTVLELNTDLRTDCVVLAYYRFENSSYTSDHVWATQASGDLTTWDKYDPKTLRKLNEDQC
jgi:hypothetical protein